MLRAAPSCRTVMARLADFIEDHDLVAHNASFDQRSMPSAGASAGAMRARSPVQCWPPAACTRTRPTTNWAPWLRSTSCP
jgi:hypothetical protein